MTHAYRRGKSAQQRAFVRWVALLSTLAVTAIGSPASAHHSAAMFDSSKLELVRGTVFSMAYVNPHSWISVLGIRDGDHEVARWDVEATAPQQLARVGIQKDTLKPGDKVTVGIRPLRDGRRGGSFVFVVTTDGKRYGADPGPLGLKPDVLKPR